MAKAAKKETPLMTQYNTIKAKYPDALLLFRVGDFYETFGQDAVRTSQILGIVLTKRANGEGHIELAGFPHDLRPVGRSENGEGNRKKGSNGTGNTGSYVQRSGSKFKKEQFSSFPS